MALPHVIVIGAGTAGLTVARHLSHNSSCMVTVLEATSRVGGRVKSVDLDGTTIDLGASWMHETRVNPLFEEALKMNWEMKFTDIVTKFYTEKGELPRKSGIQQIIGEIQSMVAECFHQDKPLISPDQSLEKFARESVLRTMPLVTDQQKQWAELMFRQVEHFIGVKWDEIPADEGGEHSPLGRDAFVLGKGYMQVIQWLLDAIDKERVDIRLSEPVVEITPEESGRGYTVKTNKDKYTADYVVCTIPIGALKTTSIFDRMKNEVKHVLDTVGKTNLAELGKVAVQFPTIEWDKEADSFCVANEETGEIITIINPFENNVLVALTAPDLTRKLESDPEHAYSNIKWAFEAISNGNVADPTDVVVTNWTQNEYFRCSYSARSIGQSYDELVAAYIEGAGKLRFAGEHTVMDGNGCVHGAFLSGIREAEFIERLEKYARENKVETKAHIN